MLMPSRVLCFLGLFAVFTVGSDLSHARGTLQGKNEQVMRVKEKAAEAVSGVQQLAGEAINVASILDVLKQVKTAGDAGENTNIHVARYVDNRTFEYLGEVQGINTEVLEGVPTVDTEGNIYFTSLRNYGKDFLTLYHARYSNGAVTDVSVLKGDFSRQEAPWLNMDSEISADGQTLYSTINRFDQKRKMMIYSNFLVLRKKGDRFFVDPGSD